MLFGSSLLQRKLLTLRADVLFSRGGLCLRPSGEIDLDGGADGTF